jgi:hypothetical protein
MFFDHILLLVATLAGMVVGATAVIASAVPNRSGSADCASYFRTTFTPPTVTMSVTKTKVFKTTTSETVLISTTDT